MKKKFLTMLVSVMMLFTGRVFASDVDILLQKLVEKGVLSAGEAQEIKTETEEQVKKDVAEGKSSSLPQWVQNVKMKGDFRLRYQNDHVNENADDRNRGRIRLRLGTDYKANDKLLISAGLATGLSDTGGSTVNKDYIRSTNQTFTDSFSKHPIDLDYAYAKYMATPWLNVIGGKVLLKDALWEPGDLMWDTDITPEGVVLDVSKQLNPATIFFVKGDFLVLQEDASKKDDVLFHVQPGIIYSFNDRISLKAALAYDDFEVGHSTGHPALKGSSASNSWSAGTTCTPRQDITNIMPAFQLTINTPFKDFNLFADVPQLNFFGEYVKNMLTDAKPHNEGYMVGLGLGAASIANHGDWQISYNYASLEKDAVLDILPDSDRMGGKTDIEGHELIFQYGLAKNTWLSFDIYRTQMLESPHTPEGVVQVDWNMKF